MPESIECSAVYFGKDFSHSANELLYNRGIFVLMLYTHMHARAQYGFRKCRTRVLMMLVLKSSTVSLKLVWDGMFSLQADLSIRYSIDRQAAVNVSSSAGSIDVLTGRSTVCVCVCVFVCVRVCVCVHAKC